MVLIVLKTELGLVLTQLLLPLIYSSLQQEIALYKYHSTYLSDKVPKLIHHTNIKIKNALATALNLGKTSSVTVDAAQPKQLKKHDRKISMQKRHWLQGEYKNPRPVTAVPRAEAIIK